MNNTDFRNNDLSESAAAGTNGSAITPENEMAVRRIGFYKRNGFFLNEYPYLQPAISKGGNEVPLLIMTYGRNITKEEFEALREVLYRIVYKRKPKEIADIIGRTEKP